MDVKEHGPSLMGWFSLWGVHANLAIFKRNVPHGAYLDYGGATGDDG